MEVFDMPEFDGHELLAFGHDAATGLKAIIAVHSTALGRRRADAACGRMPPRPRRCRMCCGCRAA